MYDSDKQSERPSPRSGSPGPVKSPANAGRSAHEQSPSNSHRAYRGVPKDVLQAQFTDLKVRTIFESYPSEGCMLTDRKASVQGKWDHLAHLHDNLTTDSKKRNESYVRREVWFPCRSVSLDNTA